MVKNKGVGVKSKRRRSELATIDFVAFPSLTPSVGKKKARKVESGRDTIIKKKKRRLL
jgi:hypothetical protein